MEQFNISSKKLYKFEIIQKLFMISLNIVQPV